MHDELFKDDVAGNLNWSNLVFEKLAQWNCMEKLRVRQNQTFSAKLAASHAWANPLNQGIKAISIFFHFGDEYLRSWERAAEFRENLGSPHLHPAKTPISKTDLMEARPQI